MNSAEKEAKEKAKRALILNKVKTNAISSSKNVDKTIPPMQKTRN